MAKQQNSTNKKKPIVPQSDYDKQTGPRKELPGVNTVKLNTKSEALRNESKKGTNKQAE